MRISLPLALALAASAPLQAQQTPAPDTTRAAGVAPPAAAAAPATATAPQGPVLTLDEAIDLARRNNPAFLQVVNQSRLSYAARRTAYGQLLPQLDASFGSRYQQQGQQLFNGVPLGTQSDIVSSSYDLSLTYQINSATFINPRLQTAAVNAAEADVSGARAQLRSDVTQQYLQVLQAQEKASLADTLVAAAAQQVELAKARAAVGSATQIDVQRAEVELGQQQVAAIRAHNDVEIQKLRLFQRLGVRQPANVQLTTAFAVTPLSYSVDSLLSLAHQQNPALRALRSREHVASLGVRRARGEYTPTLSISTGWGGYTQQFTNADFLVESSRNSLLSQRASCLTTDSLRVGAGLPSIAAQCSAIDFTPAMADQIRADNRQYPFGFTRSPWALSAQLSIPIFNGFAREERLEQAMASRNDARNNVRAGELQLTADVTAAYLTLETARKTVALQEQNAAKAKDELFLVEQRYRVGAATFLDVTQSRAAYEQAESDRINAVYDYHKAFAALESAVGQPLR